MAIKRYIANADTTITDAYKPDLKTKATGSNMGKADVLEAFFIASQAFTGSVENAKILIKFPVDQISTDRTNGDIAASGSTKFYLRMYNAKHISSTPKDFTMSVRPVTRAWQEGNGLDMEEYKDMTHDAVEGSNWKIAQSGSAAFAVAKITALSKTAGEANTRYLSILDADGNAAVNSGNGFLIDNSITTSTATKIAFGNANSNATQFATNIAAAVNAANTADTCNITATSDGAVVTLTQDTAGLDGETTTAGTAVTDSVVTVTQPFSTLIEWSAEGGDYEVDSMEDCKTATFDDGTEDLEVDITDVVEQWIAGTRNNYGLGVHMTGSYESRDKTYYTKKFFARSSQYFFKRPCVEARWDSTKKDDSGNFYVSSALAPEMDNVNTIYLYNYVRGQLQNIPAVGDSDIYVAFHTGSSKDDIEDYACEVKDYVPKNGTSAAFHTFVTGGWVETGIYSASVVVTSSLSNNNYYFPIWQYGTEETSTGKGYSDRGMTTLFTGSALVPKTFGSVNTNSLPKYVTNIKNMKPAYSAEETVRFRVHTREKDWCPTIYSKATKDHDSGVIEDAYYKIYRVKDDRVVISYGTGSTTNAAPQAVGSAESYTRTSFDITGNYFDLEMSLLEPGYSYGIKLAYYLNGAYEEQRETFKFRVE